MSGGAEQAAAGAGDPGGTQPAVPATTGPYIVALVRAVSQKWTGTIVTHSDHGLTHFSYFLQGAPCKVRPGVVVAPLDSILLRLGGIEPHALADAVSTACERPDLLLGEILIQRGLLAPELLHSALRWQVLERLNYLMTDGGAGGRHELHAGVDLIPLSSHVDLHPADPMYCIMCASRLPACEPIAQRYIERVREMRLGLTGDVDVARFGLTEEEHAVVQQLAAGALAFDELVAQGLPRAAVQRVVFALGVTQALASKGRFQARSVTMPAPPPSIPAPSEPGEPPISTSVPLAADADPPMMPEHAPMEHGERGMGHGRRRTKSVGRIKLEQRAVRRSSIPLSASEPPSARGPSPIDSFAPAHSMPPHSMPPHSMPPQGNGGSFAPPSSQAAMSAPHIPAPKPPRRRRARPSPAMPPSMPSALPPPAGAAPAPAPPQPDFTSGSRAADVAPESASPGPSGGPIDERARGGDEAGRVAQPPPEPSPLEARPAPPARMSPMLSEPFGFDELDADEAMARVDPRTTQPSPQASDAPPGLGFDDPAEYYDRDPESSRLGPAPEVPAEALPPSSREPVPSADHGFDEPVAEPPRAEPPAFAEPAVDEGPVFAEPAVDEGPVFAEPAVDEAPEFAEPAVDEGPVFAESAVDGAPEFAEPSLGEGAGFAAPVEHGGMSNGRATAAFAEQGDVLPHDEAGYEPAHGQAEYDQAGYEPAHGQAEYDQAGYEPAHGQAEYDQAGYEQPGYDQAGYEQPGYDQAGYEQAEYDQAGYDQAEYDQAGYDQAEYDQAGYEQAGYEQAEYDQAGYEQAEYDASGYDEQQAHSSPPEQEPAYPSPSVPAPEQDASSVLEESAERPIASQPVRKRGMSLSERRAYEAHNAADAAMRILDFKGADGHLQRALRFAPKNPDILAKIAYVHAMNRGRRPAGDKEFYDDELGMLRDVIKDHPRCEVAFYLRGRLLSRLMRRDEAVRDFEKAVRINPDNVDAAREVREHEARKAKKRKRNEPAPEPTSSFRGVLNWLGIDKD